MNAMENKLVYDRRSDPRPLVSFLVPVFNERAVVKDSLSRLAAVPLQKEIIIVDDGSVDGTRTWLSENILEGAALVFHARNGGKGCALQTALSFAKGAYGAVHDADTEYDPAHYADMIRHARQNNLKAVFGSRFINPNPSIYKRFLWGNKALTAWINFLCASHYTDCYTGSKLMALSVWKEMGLVSWGFEIEAEICVKLARKRVPFCEWPITYAPRRVEEGKKISWKDAWRGFRAARKFTYS